MKDLNIPYRCTPEDAKCYFRQLDTCFYHTLHQKNLFLRHFYPEKQELLSLLMICRTQAFGGDWHRRINADFLTVTYNHSGCTNVRINNSSFTAEPGDLILMPPGCDYEFGTSGESLRSAIILKGELLDGLMHHFGNNFLFSDDAEHHIEEKMERFFSVETTDPEQLAMWSFELLRSLRKKEEQSSLPPALELVIRRMKSDFEKPLALSELAAGVNITPRTLTRLFWKHLQCSPHRYLIALRMEKARQMLVWEEFSVKEVALSCGFRDALNFSTGFRKFFGCSPTAYRIHREQKACEQY